MAQMYIEVYCCYHTSAKIFVKGRLLRGRQVNAAPDDSVFLAIAYSLIRALSSEVKNVFISVEGLTNISRVKTDAEGYFTIYEDMASHTPISTTLKFYYESGKGTVKQETVFNNYTDSKGKGVISDIDDTLLITRVLSFLKLRMLINTIFVQPFRRKAVANAAKYINQLTIPTSGPVVYISNSPWNIYSYIKAFLQHNGFPDGELQLRDFGVQMLKRKQPLPLQNKYREVVRAIEMFADVTFTLVGDSAEKDYDIYSAVQSRFPSRIDQIVIIKAGNKLNEARIRKEVLGANVKLVADYNELLKGADGLHQGSKDLVKSTRFTIKGNVVERPFL